MDSNEKSDKLIEARLNFAGKMMVAAMGAWMVNKVVNTKIRGSSDEVTVIANALMSSKKFQEELQKPGATVASVMEKLRVKQMSAAEFERVLGIRWPL
jgi:hypothetical protein